MRFCGTSWIAAISVVVLFITTGAAVAGTQEQQDQQDQTTSKPKPAGRALPQADSAAQDPSGDQESVAPLRHNTQPLTGVQSQTLGLPQVLHSYLVPGFQYSNVGSNLGAPTALNQTPAAGWNSTSYVVGAVSLLRTWSAAELAVNYSGGGYFSSDGNLGNGSLHQLELAQIFQWRRWQFQLLDEFSFLPEASFGFGAGTSISIPGIGGNLGSPYTTLQISYKPSQSIFTSYGTRYSNALTPQAAYAISPRASINFAGSYGILRFSDSGNINSDDVIFNGGYNYALSKKDTIGVLYRFSAYRYLGNPQALDDHLFEAAYGHKITGRLTLELFVGPEFTTFRVPIENATHNLGTAGGVGVRYEWGGNKLTANYSRGLTNGSGIQIGSNTDLVQTGLDRWLSRRWRGNVNFGYARNRGLENSPASKSSSAFDSYYIGSALTRPIGRDLELTFAYQAQIQISNPVVCVGGSCNGNYVQHRITMAFSWHAMPVVLR
jgi:hypothetical protein